MQKEIIIDASNIKRPKYKNFVFSTYEDIIESIFEYDCVSHLKFEKSDDSFEISFELKVCKQGDLLWVLIKEYLATIIETEDHVQLEITEIEQNGTTIVYKLYNHSQSLK